MTLSHSQQTSLFHKDISMALYGFSQLRYPCHTLFHALAPHMIVHKQLDVKDLTIIMTAYGSIGHVHDQLLNVILTRIFDSIMFSQFKLVHLRTILKSFYQLHQITPDPQFTLDQSQCEVIERRVIYR